MTTDTDTRRWVDPLPEYQNRGWTQPSNPKVGKPTNQLCTVPLCTKPAPSAKVCAWCADDLEIALADTPALIEDLAIATTKQARFRTEGSGGGSAKMAGTEWAKIGDRDLEATIDHHGKIIPPASETSRRMPVPYDRRAGRIWAELSRSVVAAAAAVAKRRGAKITVSDPVRLSRYLLANLADLIQHTDAGQLTEAITRHAARAHAVIDRPKDSLYIGICPTCTTPMHADPDAATHTCGGCGLEVDIQTCRARLLERTEDAIVTATELAELMATYGRKVTRKMIEGYVARGRLVARGRRGRVATYRVGDLMDLLRDKDAA